MSFFDRVCMFYFDVDSKYRSFLELLWLGLNLIFRADCAAQQVKVLKVKTTKLKDKTTLQNIYVYKSLCFAPLFGTH